MEKFYNKCMKRSTKNKKKMTKAAAQLIKLGNNLQPATVAPPLADIGSKGQNPLATPDYHVADLKCSAGDLTEGIDAAWEERALDTIATIRRLNGAIALTAYMLDQNDQKQPPKPEHVAALKDVFSQISIEQLKTDIQEVDDGKPTQFSAPTMVLCVAPLTGHILFKFQFQHEAADAQKELMATFPE